MLNMILIDDEQIILDGISQALSETETGFRLTGVFSNPFKALEHLETNTVDLVISDIRMPKMSGLELAKKLSEDFPKIKIIFLSAYSDFEYAQEAIKYNVSSYLLKPIDIEELTQEIRKIADSLDDGEMFAYDDSDFNAVKVRKAMAELFANGSSSRINLYEKLSGCDLDISANSPAAIVEIKIGDLTSYLNTIWKYGIMRLYLSLDKLLFDRNLYIVPVVYSFDVITLIIIADSSIQSNSFVKHVSDFENALISQCAEILNLDVTLSIRQIFDSISEVELYNDNEIYAYAESLFKKMQNNQLTMPITETQILSDIKMFDDDAKILGELLLLKFSEYSDDISSDVVPLIAKLNKTKENPDITNVLCEIITSINKFFNDKISFNERITRICLKYISEHYAERITLQDIADIVRISPSHLSHIFKEITGKKYIDYLNDFRIGKAKNLLATSTYNVNEISLMVGYGSYPYFLRVFKLQTGMTPLEFKNNK